MIPKIIHQTWKTSHIHDPSTIQYQSRESILRLCPANEGWKYYLWDDEDMNSFFSIHLPLFAPIYHHLPHKIQKIDMFRYGLLYVYGGFYFDMDFILEKPLQTCLDQYEQTSLLFPVEYDLRYSQTSLQEKDSFIQYLLQHGRRPSWDNINRFPFHIGQYALASTPLHEFWWMVLSSVPFYIPSRNQNKKEKASLYHVIDPYDEIYLSTGPDLITRVLQEYVCTWNNNLSCQLLFSSSPQQFRFGDWGQHHLSGTWKLG